MIVLLKQAISDLDLTSHLSILMLDIDDFKKINDTYGHLTGDKILKSLVKVIQQSLRETDLLGRYGGEEFLMIYRNTDLTQAKIVSDRIRKQIEKYRFPEDIKVTISGGVYAYHGESLYDFIHQADINLYEAKKQGKNRII